MKVLRTWGAPLAAVVFVVLWMVGEAGRMGPWPDLLQWAGLWPLFLVACAIAVATWQPYVSLGLVGALLVGQLLGVIPPMESNYWPMYLGSFMAMAFIQWTGDRRERVVSVACNAIFAALMTVLMLSWRYGGGVGWYFNNMGDFAMLRMYGWQLLALLLLIGTGFAAAGRTLSLYEERLGLFQDRTLVEETLARAEADLVVEQERTRISRDLHDVLAHSLAVIAAQADGARYLSEDQPGHVATALENISRAARNALVDAQRVIEGVGTGSTAAPQPNLSDVQPLIERMQQSSLKITRSESGIPVDLTAGAQVAVFRIVQECLTNALRHGGRGNAVAVHFDWSGPGLTLHISSDLPESPPTQPGVPRQGRGIAGMRERAHMAGGWMSAGMDGKHFRVTVFLPYGLTQSSSDGGATDTAGRAPGTGLALLQGALEPAAAGSSHSG